MITDRLAEAEVIRKRAGMVPRRGERAEDLSGFFSLGKIRGLKNQPACLIVFSENGIFQLNKVL